MSYTFEHRIPMRRRRHLTSAATSAVFMRTFTMVAGDRVDDDRRSTAATAAAADEEVERKPCGEDRIVDFGQGEV